MMILNLCMCPFPSCPLLSNHITGRCFITVSETNTVDPRGGAGVDYPMRCTCTNVQHRSGGFIIIISSISPVCPMTLLPVDG
jgi:hypothetical protein